MSAHTVSDDDVALTGLVNLLLVLGDNKYYLGRHLSEWSVGAPVLESAVSTAAIAQQHMGQARVIYPLLDDLPAPFESGPPEETGRNRRYNVSFLDAPFASWPHAVAAVGIIDPALNTLLRSLEGTRHEGLSRRLGRMLEEERFQTEFANGRIRELVGFPDGRQLLQDLVDDLLPEMLCWFGPEHEDGVEAMIADDLLTQDNETMRQAYLDRVAPVLDEVGIALPVREADGAWDHDALPWDRWNQLQRRLEP